MMRLIFAIALVWAVYLLAFDAGAQEGRWSTWDTGPGGGYSSGTVTDLGGGQTAVQEWIYRAPEIGSGLLNSNLFDGMGAVSSAAPIPPGLRSSWVVPYSGTGSYINTWDFRDGSHSSTWTTGPVEPPLSPLWGD